MPNPKLTKGFRLAATVLVDNYWIPRQEVERYLARRQYWSQRLITYRLVGKLNLPLKVAKTA